MYCEYIASLVIEHQTEDTQPKPMVILRT